jgi:hypothetical protein
MILGKYQILHHMHGLVETCFDGRKFVGETFRRYLYMELWYILVQEQTSIGCIRIDGLNAEKRCEIFLTFEPCSGINIVSCFNHFRIISKMEGKNLLRLQWSEVCGRAPMISALLAVDSRPKLNSNSKLLAMQGSISGCERYFV